MAANQNERDDEKRVVESIARHANEDTLRALLFQARSRCEDAFAAYRGPWTILQNKDDCASRKRKRVPD